MSKKTIMVLGGAGYIGAHTCLALARAGYQPVAVDNLHKGHQALCLGGPFHQANILDEAALAALFEDYAPIAVIHLAALAEVGESVRRPQLYQSNNRDGTAAVIAAMNRAGIAYLVFSSTAAVYGQPDRDAPLPEMLPVAPINPYGESKAAAEAVIRESGAIRSVCLRYFNAAGAEDGAKIGEAHFPETHLVPLAIQAALGLREEIALFGTDYETPDGTCVRDYVHVTDLAEAHVAALNYLLGGGESDICNLGSGAGISVREVIEMVKTCTGRDFPVRAQARRAGDPAYLVADITWAKNLLDWQPRRDLQTIVQSAAAWHGSELYRQLYLQHEAAGRARQTG